MGSREEAGAAFTCSTVSPGSSIVPFMILCESVVQVITSLSLLVLFLWALPFFPGRV